MPPVSQPIELTALRLTRAPVAARLRRWSPHSTCGPVATASPSRYPLQHFAQFLQTERLAQDGSIGALQGVARVRRDRIPGREHHATLLPPLVAPTPPLPYVQGP